MTASKLSVSLDSPIAAFVEQYQREHGLRTKSEVVSLALELLRERELEAQYAAAWQEWKGSGEAEVWDVTAGDGLKTRGGEGGETW